MQSRDWIESANGVYHRPPKRPHLYIKGMHWDAFTSSCTLLKPAGPDGLRQSQVDEVESPLTGLPNHKFGLTKPVGRWLRECDPHGSTILRRIPWGENNPRVKWKICHLPWFSKALLRRIREGNETALYLNCDVGLPYRVFTNEWTQGLSTSQELSQSLQLLYVTTREEKS
ncbi:hypothetical protein M408DRAFT_227918 [Serendipita vermifera MAFF 305830]|uniref:Uncharacterized protein n=1 Tax=Serendipita vermifera MAFF 305830 TaxID=933852 RepID=A0A0C3AJT8_SERVB|nr:hypothetical protein M408DRAFT_227918 [Serendipita vermifera MAFF 305830]